MRSRPFFLALGAALVGVGVAACSQTPVTPPTTPDAPLPGRPTGALPDAPKLVRASKIADAEIAVETKAGWTYRRAGGGRVTEGGAPGGDDVRHEAKLEDRAGGPATLGLGYAGSGGGGGGRGAPRAKPAAPGSPAPAAVASPAAPPAKAPVADPAGGFAEAGDGSATIDAVESEGGEATKMARRGGRPGGEPAGIVRPLRAGSTDDNADFAEYLKFLATSEQRPDMKGEFQSLDVRERRFVRVVDKNGRPVPAADVSVVDESADRVVGRGRTYGDGRVPVYPRVGLAATTSAPSSAATGAAAEPAAWIVDVRSGGIAVRTRWDAAARESGDEFTVALPEAAAAPDLVPIDVAFLIDTTGSMGDEIASIQACLLSVAAKIRGISRESDLRVATVLYRDVGDEYLTATYPFTSDVGDLDKALRGVSANGGGDGPESLNQGLAETVDGLAWRDGAAKVAFLVADAPPHMDYAGDTLYGETLRTAVGKGIRIHTVAASGIDDAGTLVFRQVAQFTRGKFVFLEYGSAAASAASHGVTGAVKSDNLEDILFDQIRDEVARWGR